MLALVLMADVDGKKWFDAKTDISRGVSSDIICQRTQWWRLNS